MHGMRDIADVYQGNIERGVWSGRFQCEIAASASALRSCCRSGFGMQVEFTVFSQMCFIKIWQSERRQV